MHFAEPMNAMVDEIALQNNSLMSYFTDHCNRWSV